ncbi:exopolysaccharide synthesis protein exoD-related protein [alpha proteobacterium U9-1i]|nr:exopolysaccharide synthesis protein exoD-related protein [alpha proteobacterium U9-1i]
MDQTISHRPPPAPSASALLEDLIDVFPNERVSFGELIDRLDLRAHGVLLLILALPMCIPNVPGISTIFGALMMLPALQLTLGQRRLWVPSNVRAWTFPRTGLTRTLVATIPTLRRCEVLVKPRLSLLTRFPVTILVGLQTLLMAFILILPIPFANWPPGMTVAITALALLQRDGVLMLLTIPAAIASVASVYLGTRLGLAAFNSIADWVQGLIAGLN